MSKGSFIATSAISLRCTLLKEDDQRILTLFTRELGLVSVIVKKLGAKDHIKRMLTSPLVKGHYLLSPSKSDLFYLTDGHIEDAYLSLRGDLNKLQTAGQLAGTILHTQCEHKPQERLFDLLASYLHALKEFPSPQTLYLSFLLKLLRHEGLLPLFDTCQLCSQEVPTQFTEGKLCCQKCSIPGEDVSYEELQVLAVLSYATQFAQLKEIPLSPRISAVTEGLYRSCFSS